MVPAIQQRKLAKSSQIYQYISFPQQTTEQATCWSQQTSRNSWQCFQTFDTQPEVAGWELLSKVKISETGEGKKPWWCRDSALPKINWKKGSDVKVIFCLLKHSK